MRDYKEIPLWKDVTPEEWGDWKWQVKNRITDVDTLKQVINLTPEEEEGAKECTKVSAWQLHRICFINGSDDPNCPIRKQGPTANEVREGEWDMLDP